MAIAKEGLDSNRIPFGTQVARRAAGATGAMSNTDWQGAFERHPEPMVVADAGGKALHVNAAAASLEVQSALFQATRSAAAHFAALPGATPWTGATELRRRGDAAAGALAATIEVVALTASNPADAEYLCVFHLRPVAAGSASENRFKAAADCAPVMIWISATSACHDWFNQPWLAFTGRTLAQELGQGWLEGVHPEDAERCVGISTHSFEARAAFNMDFRLRRHDGVFRWVLYSGVPQWAADGQFHGFIGSCVDIDERKTLEDRLAHRTAALRRLERQRDAFLAAQIGRAHV